MKLARNIKDQLQDYMRQVDWKRLEEDVSEFRDLKQQRRVIRK